MDYECDFGYTRPLGTLGACVLDMSQSAFEKSQLLSKNEMCEEYGYYEVTSGYRKVPGNICTAGIQQHPAVYQCSGRRWLSVSGFLMMCVFAAVIYFGWPIIEAVLIMLPIPDPKAVKEWASAWLTKAKASIPKKDR